MIKRQLRRAAVDLLQKLMPLATGGEGSTRATIIGLLGLREDREYARLRSQQRTETAERLSQCSPSDATPEAMAGYVDEAALRFFHTMAWIESSLRQLALARPRLLEIGSNPYFLTLLLAEQFPHLEHLGVNYFGAVVPAMESQRVFDARNRLKESRFYHADIERHDLGPTGEFDIALFCEVLEHLPYDPAWALYNIARQLKPGAHLVLTTPNPARLENIFRLIERRETFSDPISGHGIHGRHNREYSATELQDLLIGTGFRVLQVATIDVHPDNQSRDAEERGYGAYHIVRAMLLEKPTLFRPPWLYQSFDAVRLARAGSLAPAGG